MYIELIPTAEDIRFKDLVGRTAVVFDVLRATSSVVTALFHGCRGVIPAESVDEARELAAQLSAKGYPVVLAGERGGLKIEGFPYGNSPLEFSPEVIRGKWLVLTTSNGTRAICRAARAADRVLVGSLLNAGAVARKLAGIGGEVVMVCAGSGGSFSLEDALAAGAVMEEMKLGDFKCLSDLAIAALHLARAYGRDIFAAFTHSRHGRKLLQLGREADLRWCARKNMCNIVPAAKKGDSFGYIQIDW